MRYPMFLAQYDVGRKRLFAVSHRTRLPVETLAQLLPIKHQFGITRVANVTGLDRIGLPVVLAVRPNSRSVAVSQGKGTSLEAAKASAVMEAIELWHAENFLRPMIYASHSEIDRRGGVIDVSRLPRVKTSRYSEHLRMHWVEGSNLMSGEPLLVPHEMVHADYAYPVPPGYGSFPASTNGLASGNHPLEAICHAIWEVVERDAITLWHHLPADRRAATMIDSATIDCPISNHLLRSIERAGLDVALWDATSDIGIATIYCLLTDRADLQGHIGVGSGTHADSRVALARTLTEAVQTRMNYITGSRDDLRLEEFMTQGRGKKAQEAKTLLKRTTPLRDFAAIPDRPVPTFREDLDWLMIRLGAVGIDQIACVDLSSELPDLSIVRVVIPGLESPHDDDTFVPGPRAIAAASQ
ncbi:MAG: YcaO-like family protein [Aestuariivirgaceae bacterium]